MPVITAIAPADDEDPNSETKRPMMIAIPAIRHTIVFPSSLEARIVTNAATIGNTSATNGPT